MPELKCPEAKNGFYAESFVIPSDLSKMSQKTNDKMKVLAVISTIFMPLTLIAGIYGMNFSICQNYDGNRANRWFSCLC